MIGYPPQRDPMDPDLAFEVEIGIPAQRAGINIRHTSRKTSRLTLELANLDAFERNDGIATIIFARLGLFSSKGESD